MKRIIPFFLALAIIVGIVPFSNAPAEAASLLTLEQLQAKFPAGKYWNSMGLSTNNQDGYTSTPCSSHSTTHNCNAFTYNGQTIGWQCFGFACKLGYDAYGTNPKNWGRLVDGAGNPTLDGIKPGDIINYDGSSPGHTVFVTKVIGDTVYFGECNFSSGAYVGRCVIRWDRSLKKSQFTNLYSVYKAPYALTSGGHTNHTYTGWYCEALHPHKVYEQCSCGATRYTGETTTLSSCGQCSFAVDTKYNSVKGFKAYPCVSYDFDVKAQDLSTTVGTIFTTDWCTVNEVYTNGWCSVTFPTSSGSKTAYTPISNFIKTPSSALKKYTASRNIDMYSTASLATKIHTIFSGDVCYTIGSSGSATQIFMPVSGAGYYSLGWANLAEPVVKTHDERFNPYCPIKSFPCTDGDCVVYASDMYTPIGEIWTTDYCTINTVYADGWCQVTYPAGSTNKTGYTAIWNFVYDVNYKHEAYFASSRLPVYTRKDLAENLSWWIEIGDTFYVVGEYGSAVQVFYPIDAAYGGGYKLGWMPKSAVPVPTYSVVYNANGGTGAPSAQTKTHNVALTLRSSTPQKTGHTFVGWGTSASATTAAYNAGSVYTSNASITLYAIWRKQSYTISYNANGGVNAPGSQTQTYNTPITVTSQKPSKSITVTFNANGGTVSTSSISLDCAFSNWNTNSSNTGTLVYPGATYNPNANVTLYAIYKNPTLGSYPIPTKNGYIFNGWYTAASGGSLVQVGSTITKNTTLYAHWDLETYSVFYFDDGSENIPEEQTKTYGKTLTLSSSVPVKAGYTFKGWATEESATTVVYAPGAQYTNNTWVILYPVWEKNAPTLSGIEIVTLPTKTTYLIGETFNSAGLTIKAKYSDGTNKTLSTGFTTSGFSSATAGTKTITVAYNGKTTTFNIVVEEPVIVSGNYKLSTASGISGSTVEVYVSVENNPGIISLRSSIAYDTTVLELVKVEDLGLFAGWTTPSSTINSPYTIRWADSLATKNNTANGSIVKLTFKIKEGAESGTYNISVNHIEARDVNGVKVTFAAANAYIKVEDYIIGDADNSGEVDDWDSILVNRYLAGWNVTINTIACDIDKDGEVTDWDGMLLERFLAGWDVELS